LFERVSDQINIEDGRDSPMPMFLIERNFAQQLEVTADADVAAYSAQAARSGRHPSYRTALSAHADGTAAGGM